MTRIIRFGFLKDQMWVSVISLGVILFFIFLGDAVLSYWTPNFLEDTLGSSFLMGIIMSFSSLVGLGSDLILPQIIRGITVNKLLVLSILASFLFSVFLINATYFPLVLIILAAMAIWGIYYELLGFGQQQFVADSIPLKFRSATWGILGIFRSIAYFLGPILGGALLARGLRVPIYASIAFVFISVIVLMSAKKKHAREIQIDTHEVSIFREFAHWKVLFVHVWPVVIVSLCIGLIDAVFWTVGAVWTEELADKSFLGSFILPSYMLPSIFVGFLVAKWQVFSGKKKLAEKLLLLSGVFLILLIFTDKVFIFLVLIFFSSVLLSIVYPLTDGVYSDIVARMGRERRHLIGLSQSTASLAYIAGPIVGGFLAGKIGEKETFVAIGLTITLVSFLLLKFTPRKLKLPQEEIHTWE